MRSGLNVRGQPEAIVARDARLPRVHSGNHRDEIIVGTTNDADAIAVLISDLYWQIDQMRPRGVKNAAGNPYTPSYYKRGLQSAIDRGGLAVAHYVRGYLYKAPSEGYRKLEDADSLDLTCEALIADESKPYAHLFTATERKLARERLAHHFGAIEQRKAARNARIEKRRAQLPSDVGELTKLAATAADAEAAIAINLAIVERTPNDPVAHNRLGRAYEATGSTNKAIEAFGRALAVDPTNAVARARLRNLVRKPR
jgi:tetratricopeptide (TPR) repeat protein